MGEIEMSTVLDQSQQMEILSSALDDRELELIIFPTEQCNFRCTYCYEDFEQGRLSPVHIKAVKSLISERCSSGLRQLRISWFGGEPLVAYDIVTDISSHARRLADEHGVKLNVNLTTNGSLLNEARFVELWECGAREYQISLDGDEEAHNKTRLRKGGKGSFAEVYGTLNTYNALRERGLLDGTSVMIRVHIHPDNTRSVLDLARRISTDLTPEHFSIYFKEVGYYGGKRDGAYAVYGDGDMSLDELKLELQDLLPRFRNEQVPGQVPVCYAGKANSFTIRADGSIGKCTLALSSDYNKVGILNADGTLKLDGPKLGRWLQGLSTMDLADLGCPAHGVAQRAKSDAAVAAGA
jgi:uncharacterized protein